LLGAKLLFVMLFLSIPLLVADTIILAVERFSIAEHIPGLLWSVLLITVGALTTLCAFATLMRGLTQWIISALLAVGLFLGLEEIGNGNDWGREEWMRQLAAAAMLFILAAAVLLWQYRTRRTATSRVAMAVGLLTIWLCWDNTPSGTGYEVQMALSKPKVDTSHIQVAPHTVTPTEGALSPSPSTATDDSTHFVRLGVPPENGAEPLPNVETNDGRIKYVDIFLDAAGVAQDTALFVYHVRATYELRDCPDEGATWSADVDVLQTLRLPVDSTFYSKSILCKTNIRLGLYLTLLGNPTTKVIKTDAGPLPIDGVGLCAVYGPEVQTIRCVSPLREPNNLMWVGSMQPRGHWFFFITENSYSPFPADLSISPLHWYWHMLVSGDRGDEHHWTYPPETIVTTVEPLAHFRRDLVLTDVYLPNPTRP
jgi:hypothetical protein